MKRCLDWILVLLLSCACMSASFSIVRNVNEWQICGKWIGMLFFLFLYTAIYFLSNKPGTTDNEKSTISVIMLSMNILVTIVCMLQLCGIIENNTFFEAVSDFDNPAGVAALYCSSLPFVPYCFQKQRLCTILTVSVYLIDCTLLYVIQSRAGIIGLTAGMSVWLFFKYSQKHSIRILITAFIIVGLIAAGLTVLFRSKVASTYGRRIIYVTSLNMVKDTPLLGHGRDGFAREYMDYQAEYLKTVDSGQLLLLSDNVSHPLNEYLLLAVNYGICGLTVIMSIAVWLIVMTVRRWPDAKLNILMFCAAIGTLSLFSYPFRYPLTLLSTVLCFRDPLEHAVRTIYNKSRIIRFIPAAALVISSVPALRWYKAQTEWKEITDNLRDDKHTATMLREKTIPHTDAVLLDNGRYLYSRAVVNYYAERFDESLADAFSSRNKIAAYDTEMLLGNIHERLGAYSDAEKHYFMASEMCPSRLSPLYSLFLLYERQEDTVRMEETARNIMEKPVKIMNRKARDIRLQVRKKMYW